MSTFQVKPGGCLRGSIRVPGDKSISHRTVMLGSLARGQTVAGGFLEGGDTLATLAAFRAMGVKAEGPTDGRLIIEGVGLHGLSAPPGPLDLGNSGTSMRLLAGILAGQRFAVELMGDVSLSRRPMGRVVEPLRAMGAEIRTGSHGRPPLAIRGTTALEGMDYQLPVASAQVKSCVLLAGLYAHGRTCVSEKGVTRDHTERMLRAFGYPLEQSGRWICVTGGGTLRAATIEVPADISSAAFFMVGGAIAPGSDILLTHVGVNPTRTGVIDVLRRMGADIHLENRREVGAEPVADIRIRAAGLHGIRIPERLVPLAIDEFPAIFIAAACAEGETLLTGAGELRLKESDRIQAMADGLRCLGVVADPRPDGIAIQGGGLRGGTLDSLGDHRIAMAFAMSALRAPGDVVIKNCANVDTSFPGFAALARRAGLEINTL